jgi:hypothetical protein
MGAFEVSFVKSSTVSSSSLSEKPKLSPVYPFLPPKQGDEMSGKPSASDEKW